MVAIDSCFAAAAVEFAHAHAAKADGRDFRAVAAEPPLADFEHASSPSHLIHVHQRRSSSGLAAALHEQQQRQHREGDDHHQLEVVEIGDEQRLPGDLRVDVGERRRSRDRRDRLQRSSGRRSGSSAAVICAARSACATWVIRTSCVLTTEMPTDPPMLRDRLSSAAPVVRMRGASVSNARSAAARRSGRGRAPGRRR